MNNLYILKIGSYWTYWTYWTPPCKIRSYEKSVEWLGPIAPGPKDVIPPGCVTELRI